MDVIPASSGIATENSEEFSNIAVQSDFFEYSDKIDFMDEIAYRFGYSVTDPENNAIDRGLCVQQADSQGFDGKDWLLSSLTPKAEHIDGFDSVPYRLDSADPTLYDIIKASKHTQKFFELIDADSEVKSMLQSNSNLYTVFVPTDDTFEGLAPSSITKDHIRYHILPVLFPTTRMQNDTFTSVHTLLNPPNLNGPQRLSTTFSFTGFTINHRVRITTGNFFGSNGVVHISCKGATIFAPTNQAFERLGLAINDFISTPEGNPYLQALLEYHISPNATLFSNNYYTGNYFKTGHQTINDTKVTTKKPFPQGIQRFELKDGFAADGVVHIVNCLLLPPLVQGEDGWDWNSGTELSLGEFKMRLEAFL